MTAYAEQGRLWQHLAFLMKEQGGPFDLGPRGAQDGLVEAVRRDKGLRIPRRRQSGEIAALLEQAPPQLAFVEFE